MVLQLLSTMGQCKYTPQRPALRIPLPVGHFHVTIAHYPMFRYYTVYPGMSIDVTKVLCLKKNENFTQKMVLHRLCNQEMFLLNLQIIIQ